MKIRSVALISLFGGAIGCGAAPASDPQAPALPESVALATPPSVASEAPPPPPSASASAAAVAAAPPKPLGNGKAEFDLSAANATWSGWLINGPEGAKVLNDGVHEARLAVNGKSPLDGGPAVDELDVTISHGKADLAEQKATLQGLKTDLGERTRKIVFLTDKPDRLEWSETITYKKGKPPPHTNHHFMMNIQVGGDEVSCRTFQLGSGAVTKAGLAEFEATCATVHKK